MDMEVKRKWFTKKSTSGRLYVNSSYLCFTLEDTYRDFTKEKKVYGETCIPYGIYDIIIDKSSRFKKLMPHILNVPQFEGVRIHSCNFPSELEGCIGVANQRGQDSIWDSKAAYNKLYSMIENALDRKEKVTIKISEDK